MVVNLATVDNGKRFDEGENADCQRTEKRPTFR